MNQDQDAPKSKARPQARDWCGLSCVRIVRIVVTIFLPWIALRKARRQLHIAASIMRNEARASFRKENTTLIRWADECEHDGWTIYKPYDTPEYREWINGKPNVQV